jgi:8-oxo-dGTP pyrophosphatase MutT (NUDIX family)
MSDAGYVRRAQRVVYENPWLRFEAHDIVHPNGTAGVHGVVVTPRASAVVLVDDDDVLLVRQARFAVDRVVLEVIKGGRHAGEDGLACAQRESREEAGVVAAHWHALGQTYEIPSIVQEPVSLYLGCGLTPAPLAPEAVERIDVVRMRFADALDACADGRIDDAVTAIALLRARGLLERR